MKAKLINKALAWLMTLTMVVSMLPASVFAAGSNVAKVGDTEYATIDEAIANWTSGTTLTLLADVTLSDVIQLSSTEHHILDLGTYTMTAANKKDAIQIVNNGRTSASYALDIKADAENPGGITATGKAVVRTTGKSGVKDRPIIRFYGGVFTGSYAVYHSGSSGTNCPQFWFYGGEFNGTIYTNRALNQFYGGTFHGSLQMSVDSSAYTLVAGGTFKNLSNMMGSALNSDKFTIGSAKGVYNKDVYVDDNGCYVIGSAAPTVEAGVAKTPGTNDYFAYSKVATEGSLNYTDVTVALEKNNSPSAKITVYVDELDLTDINYEGTIVVPEGESITITTEAGKTLNVEGAAVYIDAEGNELVRDEDGKFVSATPAVTFVATVNGAGYETFAEALTSAAAMSGDVTVEIYEKVTLSSAVTGSFDTITFVGKDADAEIYMDIQGAIYMTGKTVAFEDLLLSKVAGSYVADAGFRNLAFGVYAANEVSYTNCTFLNGAYASSPKDTFTNCTFYRSHDRYGMWVYGAGEVILDSCTFADIRGIKMYNEGRVAMTDLTVKNTDFSAADNKPAIVLTYGQSVTLENNTYPSTGVFELDLDGNPNGVAVTSDVPPTCVNDNGACGILVDGKIYTTAAQGNEVAAAGSNVTLLHDSAETVEFAEGVNLDKNGFTAAGVTVAAPVANVAEISGVGYTTLSEAMGAAKDGDTVTLLGDLAIDTETYTISNGVSVTLDMNGKKLTVTDSMTSGNYELFYIYGELTVTGDGTIELTSTTDRDWNAMSAIFHNRGGELTIENGTFKNLGGTDMAWVVDNSGNHFGDAVTNVEGGVLESSYTAIRNRMEENSHGASGKATVNVSGGTINGVTSAIWAQAASTSTSSPATGAINVTGGEVGLINTARSAGAECMTTISGGTVNGFKGEVGELTVKGGTLTGDVTILTAEGETANYTITNEGLYAPASYVAEINGVGYATLSEAVVAAQAGDTVVLLTDVEVSEPIVLQKSITLDGNGKTIKAAADFSGYSAFMLGDSGVNFDADIAMTIKSATFTGFEVSHGVLRIEGVTADIVGCTFTGNKQTKIGYGIVSYEAAAGTVSGCTFTANTCFEVLDINSQPGGSYVYSADEVFTVKNNLFADNMVNSTAVIYYCNGSGSAITGNTFTGNTVKSDSHAAILYYSLGTDCTVTGNVFSGNTIVASGARAGVLALEAGTVASQNVFTLNNISSTAGGTTYVATVVNKADADTAGVTINENYWGGSEPDYVSAKGAPTTAENYFASYEAGQLGGYTELAATVVANNQAELQAALDNCKANTTIQLVAGVNYGVVYMRPTPTNPATKSVDWIGNNYGYESYTCFDGLTILGADGATIDAIEIEGGTYYHTEHSQSATYPVMQSLVELKDVTIDGVTFTGKGGYDPQGYGNALNFSGNNIKVNGLTLRNCVLANAENNARLMYKTESTTFVHRYTYNGVEYTFVPNLKDITVTDCTFNGGYMGMELRETENLTVTNNAFNGVASRDMLLPANSGCTYTGTITITGNTSDGAGDRFVRGQGIGDATLIIADNTIVNYKGGDSDFIKVNDATGSVTISNNTFEGNVVEAVKENGVWIVVASVNYLAEFNGVKYETVAAALEAAQASGLTDVVITLMGETTKESAIALEDSFYLYGEKAFDKVTFRQADASKVYYIDSIYTGSRNNGGEFVFDGVNILVTGQYIFEGNVKLANNSVVKSVAEANCFIYNGTTTVEPGSKLYGVIEDFRGGDMIVDGGRTDGTYNEVADVQDSIMIVNWSGDTLTLKNGAYVKVNAVNEVGRLTLNAGTSANVYASKLEAWEYITVNGTLATDVKSQIATKVITGAGKITIDATNFGGDEVKVINADMSGFTGTIVVDGAGYEIREDGLYIVAKPVAEVDGVGYATLAEAVAAADGKTVTLLDDVVLTNTIKVLEGKTVTLDLNGKTIDGTDNVRIALMSYGNLTIKDSSAEQNGVVKAGIGTAGNAVNICAGTFTMESGSIYSLNNAILIDDQAAVINIVGGTITAEPATKNSAVMYVSSTSATEINITGGEMVGYNGILLWNNTTINMTSGSIVAQGSTGIQGNGTKDNTKINISGDASVVGYYSAIYHPQNGELNISENAVLSGWTGIVVKSGKVTISGGTINGTGAADTYRPVSSGYVDTGDALYVEHYDNSTNSENYGTPVVTVTGGTFNSTNGAPIASYANPNKEVAALAEFVSGGTFNKEPAAELAAEGYEFAANDDGTYGVVEVVTELFTLAGITTSLDSSLALNIYYTPLSGATATDYYAVVAHQKEDTVEETTIPYADWGTSGSKKLIRYTGLAAKEMADELTVTIYDADGTAVSKSFTTSFRAYAIGMMSSGQYNPTEDRVWFTALTDMLNYGAAAQQMFGYKTGDLANAGADDFQQYASTEYTLSTDGFSMSGTAWAPSLTLESTILLNFYFNDVTEGMYATYAYTTHAGTPVSATVDYGSFVSGWGHYGVAVPIAIADAGTPVTVTMFHADGSVAGTMTCSANNYLKGMAENNPDVALYPALAKFAASAKAAFAN